jgi:putative phosphoesterase
MPDARPAPPSTATARIGVIADNHGYLDPLVLELLAGVAHILHAGDVVDPGILTALEAIAPLTAVAGNMDPPELVARLPREVAGEACAVRFALGHKHRRLMKRLAEGRVEGLVAGALPELVVCGHDHMPAAAWVEGTLFLDPGSASAPHEEDDGPTVAIVSVSPAGLAVTFLPLARRELEAGSSPPG